MHIIMMLMKCFSKTLQCNTGVLQFMSTPFRCNHLLYCTLKFLGSLWIIVAEFFKLPLVFDPIGKVVNHLPVCDIIDLCS